MNHKHSLRFPSLFSLFLLLSFPLIAKAQEGTDLIGQTKQYIINKLGDKYYIGENDDTTLLFIKDKNTDDVYRFKNGLCEIFSILILGDSKLAENSWYFFRNDANFISKQFNPKLVKGNTEYFAVDSIYTRVYIPPTDTFNKMWVFVVYKTKKQ